jgi:thymidylate synthase
MSSAPVPVCLPGSTFTPANGVEAHGDFRPCFITERNLSVAWHRAFLASGIPGVKALAPLVVTVTGFDEGEPDEVGAVRSVIDAALAVYAQDEDSKKKSTKETDPLTCQTVASTIFPGSLWAAGVDRHSLYSRYSAMLPRLKRRGSRRGLYFERLINYGRGPENGNQLEHIIQAYKQGVRRRSAFQATICDPERDSTHQPLLGFPCLQQVALQPEGNTLSITGFYGTQYLFERAYGNYLGLCWLGRFLAHEMGLSLSRMTCIAAYAPFSAGTRERARQLANEVAPLLPNTIGTIQNA